MIEICIVGGGHGGLYTALSLSNIVGNEATVYLIDPNENFTFLPLLYELFMGYASSKIVTPKYSDLLKHTKVKFLRSFVNSIDFIERVCNLKSDDNKSTLITYDILLMAVGVSPKTSTFEGLNEYACTFFGSKDSLKLKNKLDLELLKKEGIVNVSILGGGYIGVELAATLSSSVYANRLKISIVDSNENLLKYGEKFNRKIAVK
jgi:NADH dehydrogenase